MYVSTIAIQLDVGRPHYASGNQNAFLEDNKRDIRCIGRTLDTLPLLGGAFDEDMIWKEFQNTRYWLLPMHKQ